MTNNLDVHNCPRCNKPFTVNTLQAISVTSPPKIDDIVLCTECGMIASIGRVTIYEVHTFRLISRIGLTRSMILLRRQMKIFEDKLARQTDLERHKICE